MTDRTSSHPAAEQPATSPPQPRDVLRAVAFLIGFVVVALAAFFAMPSAEVRLDNAWDAALLAVLAVLLLTAVHVSTLRRLHASKYPLWSAVSLVVVSATVFLLVFAYVYLNMQTRDPGQLPGLDTHLDALYFTVTMIATVGFGDIAPTGQSARAVATIQMAFNLVFLGFIVRTVIDAGRRERKRRDATATTDPD